MKYVKKKLSELKPYENNPNEAGGQFKAQVKAIVKKYADGGSLTNVPAESYSDLVKEVEGLKDA